MAKLIDNTVVVHPETGEPVLLAATGDLPEWAADLVGDHLLDPKPIRRPKSAEQAPAINDDEVAALKARIAELEREKAGAATPTPATAGPGSVTAKVPPRSGPGSGAPEWRAYAAHLQVEVPASAGRDEVIAALDAAGKPTK